ncbi:phenylacetate--CoA ligase family protein [candidate division KSB1 bacterium]|nr:phenylacetate--CoA ligase family protein [candidate division KSB1 bacterium]RQW01093.1 MAG: phenylacetate--CoA ligase family protein [candidate division KSB1 bacterium]
MNCAAIEKNLRANLSFYAKLYHKAPIFLQNAIITARGWVLSRLRYQKLFWKTLAEIKTHDFYSAKELRQYQNTMLQDLIRFAYAQTVYYREVLENLNLGPHDIRDLDDLNKLPILTRDQVKRNTQKLQTQNDKRRITVHTSGSCGSGLAVSYNSADLVKNWAFLYRQLSWAGVQPREWRLTLYGSKIVPESQQEPPFWRYNLCERQILLSIFHLSEKTKNHYIRFLLLHRGAILEGFASILAIMAEYILEQGLTIPMKMVYSTGEPMTKTNRKKVQEAFGCTLYDCYGMTEWVGLIQECERGEKHVMVDYGILEIIDDENKPCARGQEGYLVWTGLQHLDMPLIRYRIGDKGMWCAKDHCECGRNYPLVHTTITRDSDNIKTPDGRIYSPRVINQFLKNKQSFNYCQFIQDRADSLIVRIVPGIGDVQGETQMLLHDLDHLLQGALTIRTCVAERPIMRGEGKYPFILNHADNHRPNPPKVCQV